MQTLPARDLVSLALFSLALCAMTGCGGDTTTDSGTCTAETFQCTEAEVLQECVDNSWSTLQDCAATNEMCMAEHGHCMPHTGDSGMAME